MLGPADQRHIAGFVVNKFRGDLRLIASGLDMLAAMAGRPTLGVLPWRQDLWLDAEDSLTWTPGRAPRCPPHGAESLPFPGSCAAGAVQGTSWHGIFESDGFRRAFLRDLAARAGRDFTPAPGVSFAAVRERRYDTLADMISQHLDTGAVEKLITGGVPTGLPAIVSGLAG